MDLSAYNLPIYIISIVLIFFVWLFNYNERLVNENLKINKNRFVTPKSRWMYLTSFKIPFVWFVEDDNDLTEKGLSLQRNLKKIGLDAYFTPRSWMALKVFTMFASLILTLVASTLMANMHIVLGFLFGIESVPEIPVSWSLSFIANDNLTFYVIALDLKILVVLLILSMYPTFFVKSKLSKLKTAYNKDIPILQMFIILMLRSKKTISEIIYGLSKIDTPHSTTFKTAHRIFIRSHTAGIEYLKDYFSGHRFGDTFTLMEELDLYSRDDTINIMQSNLVHIIEDIKLDNQKNASSKVIYSQASMVIPFISVLLLGAVPVIVMGLSNFSMNAL